MLLRMGVRILITFRRLRETFGLKLGKVAIGVYNCSSVFFSIYPVRNT